MSRDRGVDVDGWGVLGMLERVATLSGSDTLVEDMAGSAAVASSHDIDAALQRFAQTFGLSRFETDLVLVAGMAEEHELLCHAFRRLHPNGEPYATVGLAATMLRLTSHGRVRLREAFAAGPIQRHGLIRLDGERPFPERSLRLVPELWSVLSGVDSWPDTVLRRSIPLLAGSAGGTGELERALALGQCLVMVSGGHMRIDEEFAAHALRSLSALGRPAVVFRTSDLDADGAKWASAHAAARGLVPVLVGADGPLLAQHPGPVVVCGRTRSSEIADDERPAITIEIGDRTIDENLCMWRDLAPELNGGAERLASMISIDGARAARAASDARAISPDRKIGTDQLLTHVRRRTTGELPASVHLTSPRVTWDRLVTTGRNLDLLRSIVDRVDHAAQVLGSWGYGDIRHAAGVKAMFAGPPGTGKTFASEVIASALGLDLLVVDLSSLVSKWLGETEKNISEVFDAAERTNAVLLFDEADSIFAKRTDASDAQGRWANLETAHLLMRMEQSSGLIILATNLKGNLDDAFMRRLDVVVEFNEPGVHERERLWRAHLPSLAPVAPDVDVTQLAALYPITGGVIRNAAIDAAYRAAAIGTSIHQMQLVRSIEREFDKAGRSFPGIPPALLATTPGGS